MEKQLEKNRKKPPISYSLLEPMNTLNRIGNYLTNRGTRSLDHELIMHGNYSGVCHIGLFEDIMKNHSKIVNSEDKEEQKLKGLFQKFCPKQIDLAAESIVIGEVKLDKKWDYEKDLGVIKDLESMGNLWIRLTPPERNNVCISMSKDKHFIDYPRLVREVVGRYDKAIYTEENPALKEAYNHFNELDVETGFNVINKGLVPFYYPL